MTQDGCALGEVSNAPVSGSQKPGPRCDGCPQNHYSAPGGQHGRPEPHSWCLHFQRAIPMRMGPHDKWLASEIPPGCPTFAQRPLFG